MIRTALSLMICMILIQPAAGQDAGTPVGAYQARLIKLNEKDFYNKRGLEDTIKGKIQDRTNRVIGEVQDVLVKPNGFVETVVAEIDGFGSDQLFLSAEELAMETTRSGYRLPFHRDAMDEMLPAILSNIATAAGTVDEPLTALSSFDGRAIFVPGNVSERRSKERFAQVSNVIMNQEGTQVTGLIIERINGAADAEAIIIPYPTGLDLANDGFENGLFIEARYAEAIRSFATTLAE